MLDPGALLVGLVKSSPSTSASASGRPDASRSREWDASGGVAARCSDIQVVGVLKIQE